MSEKKESIKVNIDNGGPAFFSDSITVFHNQMKFVLDFQQATPRFTRIGDSETSQNMYVRHNAVVLDPILARDLLNILKDNIEKYEKTFGKIKVNKRRKSGKPVKTNKKVNHTKSYIG
ncbi:MAG: DUF3467 domain-containing protein [Candidatus Aenigmarchaeota archaeon]|nr:DUF3467 domain-containing protein [Candidatus Aenigmarchaeota archaeon]